MRIPSYWQSTLFLFLLLPTAEKQEKQEKLEQTTRTVIYLLYIEQKSVSGAAFYIPRRWVGAV
jgi:hypothetical protein